MSRKTISFSLFGDNPLYTLGAIENARLSHEIYPDWEARFYIDQTVPNSVIDALSRFGAQIEIIDTTGLSENEVYLRGTFWRFFALADDASEYVIFRDCDSRLSDRERSAVAAWIESGKDFHFMYDHPYHSIEIMAGMWGARGGLIGDIKRLIEDYWRENLSQGRGTYLADQLFLRDVIFRRFVKDFNYLAHGDYQNCEYHRSKQISTAPFPAHGPFAVSGGHAQMYVGQTIDVPHARPKARYLSQSEER